MTYTQEEVDAMLNEKDKEIKQKDKEIEKKDKEIKQKDKEIEGLRAQVRSDDNGHSATSSTGPAALNPVPPAIGGGNVTAGTDVRFTQAVPRAGNGLVQDDLRAPGFHEGMRQIASSGPGIPESL
ncbi:hypothetical protein BDK51DRAFT_33701 [Blyttiomyces helicus]|uniref:Uncharacterized protein n=1 Tax=Blyttiomyces helicus TaxID=388810 RepID=A0A4P9VY07_9FUNG|nr:hypothetical protein BDK51DRAFT_33701 [Blyttiomyces helicus]|eukprot:RKO83178.1 hypothetical protein BDK51DRAFT_33701 [Blyttiomyces helicus]